MTSEFNFHIFYCGNRLFLFCYALNINNRRCAKLLFSFHSIINFRNCIDSWVFPDIDRSFLWQNNISCG